MYIDKEVLEETLIKHFENRLNEQAAKLFVEFMSVVDEVPIIKMEENK